MHAEKDYHVTILNTETVDIGEKYGDGKNSRSTTLKQGSDDLKIEKGNQTVYIKQNQTVSVDDTISITAQNKITLTVGQSKITLERAQITLASPTIDVQSDMKTTVSGGMALDLLAQLIKIN